MDPPSNTYSQHLVIQHECHYTIIIGVWLYPFVGLSFDITGFTCGFSCARQAYAVCESSCL